MPPPPQRLHNSTNTYTQGTHPCNLTWGALNGICLQILCTNFYLHLLLRALFFSIQKSSQLAEPWGSWSLLSILARHKHGTQKAKAKPLIISNSSSNIHLHFYTFSCPVMWSKQEYFCSAFYKRYVCFSRNISAKTVCD